MVRAVAWGMVGALLAGAAWADPVEGRWKTAPDDNGHTGVIEIKPCGAAFCGVLVEAFDETGASVDSPEIGKRIVWDMVAQGDGYYDSGMIWAPDRDKTYKSRMTLAGDGLTVQGCVLFICRDGGTWQRVK